MRLESGKNY